MERDQRSTISPSHFFERRKQRRRRGGFIYVIIGRRHSWRSPSLHTCLHPQRNPVPGPAVYAIPTPSRGALVHTRSRNDDGRRSFPSLQPPEADPRPASPRSGPRPGPPVPSCASHVHSGPCPLTGLGREPRATLGAGIWDHRSDLPRGAHAARGAPGTAWQARTSRKRTAMDLWFLLPLCGILIESTVAEPPAPKDLPPDPFNYDYRSLRIGGLVFAVILFLLGILIVLSRRCRCKFNQQQRTGEPDETEGALRSSIRRLSTRMR
ncbi:uncharacterized protein LOC133370844 [Rhineura floridana]|uniref:uncharacterized protein LOC133370844 n=1 Tax=Rhineura floridana TaxID=261503 RepID=UPI002AC82088|nr:uncharacterized protein LOC133370844 [Rhineura floridana]